MSTRKVFQRAQRGVKAVQLDADGNEVEFDVREDEEQDVKLNETIQLLLAAGYFRARIKGLSPFDKIVGGMTWCITSSNEEVDVDILFEENASIGQRIAVTEKIVAALPRLKCPLQLEPHQIQGLDFIHIFPVVQWLVRKALESREEMMYAQRCRALFVFERSGKTPEDEELEKNTPAALTSVSSVQLSYAPKRVLKAPDVGEEDEETRVQCTLLEYGRRYGLSKVPKKKKDSKSQVKAALTGGEDEEDLVAQEERRVKAMMKRMNQLGSSDVSTSALGEMAGIQSEELKQLAEEYNRQAAEIAAEKEKQEGGIAAHNRTIASLEKQHEVLQKRIEKAQAKIDELKPKYDEALAVATKAAKYSKRMDKEMAKLDEIEQDEANKESLEKLRALLAQIDKLKDQESKFKATCVSEMESLEEKIEKMKGSGHEVLDDDRVATINKQMEAEQAKMGKIKNLITKRNREIATRQRQIDEYPSRSELNQYQRRFVELYGQVSARLRETKQYYLMYNTSTDTKQVLSREVSLLDSIQESFEMAMKSAGGREQLLQQMQKISEQMIQNREKSEEKKTQEKENRDEIRDRHLKLVEKERLYHQCVKDYGTECAKNEALIARLKG
eukprot:m.334806 g.334806  ORF g.334806 m.334806 type:complete len:615 (+) comp17444_c0_seq1:141-1985(+)